MDLPYRQSKRAYDFNYEVVRSFQMALYEDGEDSVQNSRELDEKGPLRHIRGLSGTRMFYPVQPEVLFYGYVSNHFKGITITDNTCKVMA